MMFSCHSIHSDLLGRSRALLSVSILLWLSSASLALAQVEAEDEFRTSWRSLLTEADFEVSADAIQLDLEDAVAIALERNLGLRVERFRRAQIYYGIQQNKGVFDLNLGAVTFAFDETRPSASQLDGSQGEPFQAEGQGLNLSLDQLLSWGGIASLAWDNSRDTNNSIFSDFNPGYGIDFDFVYSQPLLRDLGKLATKRNLLVSQVSSDIALSDLRAAVIQTVQLVENSYWLLVETRAQLQVAQESLALAEELHEMNQIQVEVGTLAPLELIQSEVGIATRQEEIIRARAAVQDAADLLRRLLNVQDPRYWEMEVAPVTDPEGERIEIDLEEAMELALARRPEIERQRLQMQTLALDSQFFRNQKRPRLDLQARYGWNALDGDQSFQDPDDPENTIVLPGGWSDAFQQILDGDFEGWQVGVQFAYPIQNRSAKARSLIADLALEQGETQLENVELQIRTDVRTAARGVETAAQQIDSARVSMRLAEENLEAERKRYENGLSTSFQVLEIQEDLTQARSRLVNSITGYRRALVQYYVAIGQLLEENGIELVDDVEEAEME